MRKLAIEASQALRDVLQLLAEGRFSPGQPDRYNGILDRIWHHDYFLVASDFDAYDQTQQTGRKGLCGTGKLDEDGSAEHCADGIFLVRSGDPQLHEGHLVGHTGLVTAAAHMRRADATTGEEGTMAKLPEGTGKKPVKAKVSAAGKAAANLWRAAQGGVSKAVGDA